MSGLNEGIKAKMSREHWDSVYKEKGDEDLSWFQPTPETSLSLIQEFASSKTSRIIDVGGGTSTLPAALLQNGFSDVTVLDISLVALEQSRARLGHNGGKVKWIHASVTEFKPSEVYEVWHDRAVFHFLTRDEDRKAYVRALGAAIPSGCAIISTFAMSGPEKCSGLPVERYDAGKITSQMGAEFRLVKSFEETHATPWGTRQQFANFVFARAT